MNNEFHRVKDFPSLRPLYQVIYSETGFDILGVGYPNETEMRAIIIKSKRHIESCQRERVEQDLLLYDLNQRPGWLERILRRLYG